MPVRHLLAVAQAVLLALTFAPMAVQAGIPSIPTPTASPSPEQTPVPDAGCGEQVAPLCAADCGPLSNCIPLDLLIPGAPGCVCEPPTPTPPPPTPDLNHFQCYDVRRQAFDERTVSLVDDFGSSTAEVRRPKQLCAPVNKNGEDPTAPTDPDHLVGYQIRRDEPRFEEVRDELVEDQFGALVLDLRRPERLLVPSAKSLTDPATPLAPAVVDHYQCYAVRGDRRRVADITLDDQFGTGTTAVKKPSRLCVPVDKDAEGILDGAARLMCYRIKSGPRVNETVYVDNQFGAGSLEARRARELCVPVATPNVPVTPTPTATVTPTPTSTPMPIDCVVSEFGEWSACSATCGSGTRTRVRTIVTPPAFGGQACPALEETETCNTQPCPVDCVVGPWSDWGPCSVTCGGGTQTRTRPVLVLPAFGGVSCPALEEMRACNSSPCP